MKGVHPFTCLLQAHGEPGEVIIINMLLISELKPLELGTKEALDSVNNIFLHPGSKLARVTAKDPGNDGSCWVNK